MRDYARETVTQGLDQLPSSGLRRVIDWIREGKPILLSGAISNDLGHG